MPAKNFPLMFRFVLPVLLVAGCSSPVPREAGTLAFPHPKQWSGNGQLAEAFSAGWLDAFNDAQLKSLVTDGLNGNFDLKAAAARVTAAREQVAVAGAGRWPQLWFTPDYQRSRTNSGSTAVESGNFDALFNFSWELDVWGRIKAGQQASLEDAEAVNADYGAARLSLAARIAQTYFEFSEAQLQVSVAEQSVKDRGVIADLVRGRFNKGLTRGLDLRLVLTDQANAEAQLAQARNDVQLLGRRLQILLGRYPDGKLIAVNNVVGSKGANDFAPTSFSSAMQMTGVSILPEPPAMLAAGLPAELLSRRPDIDAAFKRLQATDSRLESAEKALLPRITLTAAGGASSPALTELIDPRAAAWNLAAGLAQPLFNGGRLRGEIRVSEARVQEAYHQYQSVALNAFKEVEQALAAEAWLSTQEKALREAVAQTEASRKLAIYSYRQGLIEILTLLDSYRSTLNAQSAHLAVQRQLLNNRINLYLALGGDV